MLKKKKEKKKLLRILQLYSWIERKQIK